MLDTCNSPAFESLPPSQIVPRLADEGRYIASEASFYRILRAEEQQHHRGRAKPPVRRPSPTSHRARGPCQVWTWDITWMPGPIRGGFFYLYLILDIFSRKIVGWEVHEREAAELASEVVRRAVWAEGCLTRPLVLHADNGSPMKGATMKATLERLGIIASYSRPRVADDNPFSEALFRTCKYRPDWPASEFASRKDAQHWVACFVTWYNQEHRHSAIRFVTPSARHAGEERALLERRTDLYAKARAANPARWSRQIRNWTPAGDVCLNPERDTGDRKIRDAA
ncbi:Transposase InsO and inactivated derivatives [Belnapia rosea]|uniref:Transposase InsO and inactivated derivatives n=1 Tax=Belnapia rosea TaxID=938405 RepID=A0A1G7ERA1_9PROT|nr:Transposase InsO and inactivated derivatives [Belnapia rosea]